MLYTVSQRPTVSEDLEMKRNEAYAAVPGISMQTNEAYSAVVPLQRNEAYSAIVPLQRNEAYGSVVRPANTLDTQSCPDYEIIS